jgi:ABC-2 type transport system ATP-binding protein
MSEDSVVEVTGLTKRYGEILAVDHINMHVKRSEIFGFLGPNGAGKTTTIRMLTGLTKPTSGTATISGKDCVKEGLAVRQTIGVVSETSNLYNELSAWDNLQFIGGLYGVDKSTRAERAKQLLQAFQLYERRNDPLAGYSKGMKRRVRIAAALIHDPEILFLDEPTSGLDVQSSRIIRTLLRELNKRGMTIFLTTHYIDEADELCGRVAIIRQGRVIVEGPPEQLKSSFQGEHIIEVALSGSSSDFEAFLKDDSAVKEVTKQGDKYHVNTVDVNSVIKKIVEFAASAGLEIISMNTSQPSLEDIFVKYTGLDAVQLERMELLRAVKVGGQRA